MPSLHERKLQKATAMPKRHVPTAVRFIVDSNREKAASFPNEMSRGEGIFVSCGNPLVLEAKPFEVIGVVVRR